MTQTNILIVDDEEDIRDMVALSLKTAGYHVLQASDGQEGFSCAIDHKPQLIVIDWMMPVVNGLELLRRLRRDDRTREIPVIMLSAKAEIDNKTQGLDSGADDYLTKPFSPKELISRIKAILRRHENKQHTTSVLKVKNLVLDASSHVVSINEQTINLGPTEFKLLQFFMRHTDKVYSREQLLDQVWGNAVYIDERTVDVHIRWLRQKIEIDPANPQHLITVRGTGYKVEK